MQRVIGPKTATPRLTKRIVDALAAEPRRRLRCAANLPDNCNHDRRHTFASIAVAGGVSPFIVGNVLGHTQARTTESQAPLHAPPAQQVADRIAAELSEWSSERKD
jgi:integrase